MDLREINLQGIFKTRPTHLHAQSLQSCPTLCDPVDRSQPGSSVHSILPARILERVAMPKQQYPQDFPLPILHPPETTISMIWADSYSSYPHASKLHDYIAGPWLFGFNHLSTSHHGNYELVLLQHHHLPLKNSTSRTPHHPSTVIIWLHWYLYCDSLLCSLSFLCTHH